MSQPYGVARTQSGARTTSASGEPSRRRVAHELVERRSSIVSAAPSSTEPWRFAQTTSGGRTSSVRRADAVAGGVEQEPEHAGEERERGGLRTDRPAPRAGERRRADRRGTSSATWRPRRGRRPARGRARRRRAGRRARRPRGCPRARARRRRRGARATAGRSTSRRSPGRVSVSVSGSPWSTTSRPAISISQVSPTTSAGPKAVSSRIPTSETSRIGNGLDSSTPRSPVGPAGAATRASARSRLGVTSGTVPAAVVDIGGRAPVPVACRGRSPQTGPGCTLPRRV